jgi:hypothetical protein
MDLYHGSNFSFPTKVIKPFNDYTSQDSVKELEALFESVRPHQCIFSRLNCVFLASREEHIDYLGGYTDYIYLVVVNNYEQSDLAWYSQADRELEEGDIAEAKKSALKYWLGEPFDIPEHSLFEYRTDIAYIEKIK